MRAFLLVLFSNLGVMISAFSVSSSVLTPSRSALVDTRLDMALATDFEDSSKEISRREAFNVVVGGSIMAAAVSAGVEPAVAADIASQMKELEKQFGSTANSNGAPEKHLPKVTLGSIPDMPNLTKVEVLVPHVMDAEKPHFIQAIWLKEAKGGDVAVAKVLPATEPGPPKLVCGVPKGTKVTPYLYCNLHGLWKGEPFTA